MLRGFPLVNTIGSYSAVRAIQGDLLQYRSNTIPTIIGDFDQERQRQRFRGFPLVPEFSADRTPPTTPDLPTSLLSVAPPYDDDHRDDCVAS